MASALSNRQNCACARKTLQHKEDRRTAPGVCGNGSVPLSHSGNVVTKIGTHTHTYLSISLDTKDLTSLVGHKTPMAKAVKKNLPVIRLTAGGD